MEFKIFKEYFLVTPFIRANFQISRVTKVFACSWNYIEIVEKKTITSDNRNYNFIICRSIHFI